MNRTTEREHMAEPQTVGEKQVPEQIWKLPHFQSWLQAQKKVGNRLDGFKPVFEFYVANGKFLFMWGAQVDVYVKAEDRNKSNEIVIARPDIKHVVLLNEGLFDEPHVVLVREFRSPATTPNGFILESPGGSSYKKESARETAVAEVFEETGIRIDPERLVPIGSRQLAGTLSAHKAHVYAVNISNEELTEVSKNIGKMFGDIEGSEQTYIEIHSIKELLRSPTTDWSTLGMVAAAIEAVLYSG
jgi:8-oxo-dGTP pyrophosphatase MutT (NUDIX family)